MNLPDFLIIPSLIISDKELQPLDGYVYGVVYWYTRLKLERCIASNEYIADLLHVKHPRSISNSLTRLKRKKYVKIIMDDKYHRKEIVPLIKYRRSGLDILDTPSSNDDGGFIKRYRGGTSNDEHNNIDLKRKFKNTFKSPSDFSEIKKSSRTKEIYDSKGKLIGYKVI